MYVAAVVRQRGEPLLDRAAALASRTAGGARASGAAGRRPGAGSTATSDGFFAGQDCNDANAAIRPGAIEIKGNRSTRTATGSPSRSRR